MMCAQSADVAGTPSTIAASAGTSAPQHESRRCSGLCSGPADRSTAAIWDRSLRPIFNARPCRSFPLSQCLPHTSVLTVAVTRRRAFHQPRCCQYRVQLQLLGWVGCGHGDKLDTCGAWLGTCTVGGRRAFATGSTNGDVHLPGIGHYGAAAPARGGCALLRVHRPHCLAAC